jgi:hypothetical protein
MLYDTHIWGHGLTGLVRADPHAVESYPDREGTCLLKITLQQSRRSKTLKLEGKLVGPWVEELERTWRGLIASRHAKYLQVDLCGLTFLDDRGKELLAKMFDRGADLVADAPLTRHIVEEIRRDGGGRKRKSGWRPRRLS